MMTREQIEGLPDITLAQAVAVVVLGWERTHYAYYVRKPGFVVDSLFDPLANWNHTWEVVEAMRGKGFEFCFGDCDGKTEVSFSGNGCDVTFWSERRDERCAILRAALMAMQTKGST